MEPQSLRDLIAGHLDNKGLNAEKIAQLSGIPKHYIEAIIDGEWHKLPPAPYARGYFRKLETILGTEENLFWNLYKEETTPQTSGATDKLPANRFALKTRGRKWIWIAAVVLLAGVYITLNAGRFLGIPALNVTSPLTATAISSFPNYTISGQIDPKDKLYINEEEVFIDKDGNFRENYNLRLGLNAFEIVAKRFLGKETKVVKKIIYQSNP